MENLCYACEKCLTSCFPCNKGNDGYNIVINNEIGNNVRLCRKCSKEHRKLSKLYDLFKK